MMQKLNKMKTQTNKIKNLFTSNFATLSPALFDLNGTTLKVNASYEDGEGDFYSPELILNAFDRTFDKDALDTMIEAIEEEYVEVEFKKENDDYIITAGNNEGVYVMKLQVIRVK
jgi:hypothetical protein